MKTIKIVYWVSTGLFALLMSYSAYAYLSAPAMEQAFQHLGYPGYFRIELAIGKLLGAVLLLVPVGARIKEWVYAGFGIVLISAFIAHMSLGDPVNIAVMPLVFGALLAVSYITFHRSQRKVSETRTHGIALSRSAA